MERLVIGRFLVGHNDSGELFVKIDTDSGNDSPELRISKLGDNKLIVTSHSSIMQPTSINGLDAFRITKI